MQITEKFWRLCALSTLTIAAVWLLHAQQTAPQSLGEIKITGQGTVTIAIPDFKGAGAAAPLMNTFNGTLWSDIQSSGQLKMAAKSFYPLRVPQQPTEFQSTSPSMAEWSAAPIGANYLAIGYTAVQDGRLLLLGWLLDLSKPDVASAQVLGKRYYGNMDEAGARDVAHQFSADILNAFGFKSLTGSKIYYISQRGGNKEVWSMDYDGTNQKELTHYGSISITPAVSADGSKIAFTSYAQGQPVILVHSTVTGRKLPFLNQRVSLNTTPEFTPDGSHILFSSTAGGNGYANLFEAAVDGSNLRRLTSVRAIEVEPKVNPKTGNEILFTSGRGGHSQIYIMNRDGGDVQRVTSGEGEATNPSWSPDGQRIAFAWTRGFAPGDFNIFVMDVNKRDYIQLTHAAGRNENPTWAPDGIHLAFQSNRVGGSQLWSMRVDGSDLKQLTNQGRNYSPVWR